MADEESSSSTEEFGAPFRRQGSIRKVLPPVPTADQHVAVSAKIIESNNSANPKGNEAYAPYFLEYALLAEFNMVQRQKINGIYVIPASSTPLQWFGVLFVKEGYYEGGVFKFTLHIPDTYPDGDCPRVMFEPPVFHPQVDPDTGELDLSKGFQKWRRNVNHLWQILAYTKRAFYKIETSDPLDANASNLYENDIEVYKRKASEAIQRCGSRLLEPPNSNDPHAIRFSPWDQSVHEQVRRRIVAPAGNKQESSHGCSQSGISWVDKDSVTTFSKCKPYT